MRIRMLKEVRSARGLFEAGKVYDLEDVAARSWIGFQLAEEDKAHAVVPEVKMGTREGANVHRGPNVTLVVEQGTSPVPVPPPGVVVPVKRELVGKVSKKK